MFKLRKLITLIILLVVCSVNVQADDGLTFDVTADYYGKYIWRGQNLSDDPVFQSGVSTTIGGLTLGWWANTDTTKINNNSGEFTEHDWYVDYSGNLPGVEGVGYSVGAIYYYFPSLDNGAEDTTEIYGGLGFDLLLSPSVTVYHDIEEVDGTYVSFALSHSIDRIASLGPETPIAMEMGASLGWGSKSYNQGYWGDTCKSSKLNDLALSVSFPIEICGWTVAPSLNYVTLMNSKIRKTDAFASGGNKASDYFFAGISISRSF